MFIGHKSNTIQVISDVEWICRSQLKGQTPEEYWAWVKTKTTVSGTAPDTVTTVDFSGETEYTIVECKIDDEDIEEITTSAAVPGYSTPFAFSKSEKDKKKRLKKIN